MNKLKSAFDSVRSEDTLKAKTLLYLQWEIYKRGKPHTGLWVKRLSFASIAIIAALIIGVYSYNIYFTPSFYMDVDINPSIELTLNRYDRVIGYHAYNDDGQYVLDAVKIKHSNYLSAFESLIGIMMQEGFTSDDGFVSVTLHATDGQQANVMLLSIELLAERLLGAVLIDAFPVDAHLRAVANELNISPAKYIAIQELIYLDPTVTVDGCRHRSISDIRHEIEGHIHGGYGHGGQNGHMHGGNRQGQGHMCSCGREH